MSQCRLDAAHIQERLQAEHFDIVLADAEHHEHLSDELDHLRRVHTAHPQTQIVLLVSAYDRQLVVQAFRTGVRGLFCFSNSDFRSLCKCLQCVRRGQVWANSEQLNMLLDSLSQSPTLRVASFAGKKLLSKREEQVVALVADGFSNRQVAVALNLTENTIKKYVFRIFEKLGVSSRVELVLYAVHSRGWHEKTEAH